MLGCACRFLLLPCPALRLKQAKGVVAINITWRIEMPIYVHNKRKYKGNGEYIGRPSPLGNPYSHLSKGILAKYQVATRDEAVEMYSAYIRQQLVEKNQQVKDTFNRLYAEYQATGELHLICWCAPCKCHGDVIREILLNKAKERGELK